MTLCRLILFISNSEQILLFCVCLHDLNIVLRSKSVAGNLIVATSASFEKIRERKVPLEKTTKN